MKQYHNTIALISQKLAGFLALQIKKYCNSCLLHTLIVHHSINYSCEITVNYVDCTHWIGI